MEKHSKAVGGTYPQSGKGEAHPMAKYMGRLVDFCGKRLEVVGYSRNELTGEPLLIVEAPPFGGWSAPEPSDVIFKECESYWYAGIKDLIG